MKIRRSLEHSEFVAFETVEKGFDPEYIVVPKHSEVHPVDTFKQTMKIEYLNMLAETEIEVSMANIHEEFNRIQHAIVHVF